MLSLVVLAALSTCHAAVLNIEELGAVPNNGSIDICYNNTEVFNRTLKALNGGDTLLIPKGKTFWFVGGIYGTQLKDVVIQIDGIIKYSDDREAWPRGSHSHVLECMFFEDVDNITFTSSNPLSEKGLIDGNGKRWWGAIEYLIFAENRPRLLKIHNARGIEIYNIYFKNSPYWNVLLDDVDGVHIHYSNVSARREDYLDYHDLYDLTAFNTDGFDVAGRNVHIHDCEIWNDDDCIAVKDIGTDGINANCSENMLFERLNASGLGLTIGSIGPSADHHCVNNITFRDVYMNRTFKGIYLKSRPGGDTATGQITNVLYENVVMDGPTQVPIWIGPQQAIYNGACSLLWPEVPFEKCPVPWQITWANITLRNVTINDPRQSPGVILGNKTNPMKNVVFDGVVVNNPGTRPWGDQFYACDGVENGQAIGGTKPVPPCFNNGTAKPVPYNV